MTTSEWNEKERHIRSLEAARDRVVTILQELYGELHRLERLGLGKTSYGAEVRAILATKSTEATTAKEAVAEARKALSAEVKAERDAKCKKCGGDGYITRDHQSNDGSMSSDYSWTTQEPCSCKHGKAWAKKGRR